MTRPLILALGISAMLAIAACSSTGGGGSTAAVTASAAGSVSSASPAGGGGKYGYGNDAAPSTSAPASAAVASGTCSTSDAAGTVTAAMDGRAFVPSTIKAKVGDVIAFTNGDPVPHSATLDDGSCTTKRLGKGETGALVFAKAGTYPFHCVVHPDMKGTFEITS